MNRIPQAKREQIIALLVEGNSVRGTTRIADVSYNAVLQFIPKIGAACDRYHDQVFRNLFCKRIEVDEIWSFCHTKRKNLTEEKLHNLEYGDLWTFVALDPETKLAVSWMTGKRNVSVARVFIQDLRDRLGCRTKLSTDGYKAYLDAVGRSFQEEVDYGMLVKIYDDDNTDPETVPLHTEPSIKSHDIIGNPGRISTSAVERQNLTMRQSMRRFIRRTNGHSKKAYNHACAVALHFAFYNFCRVHQSLRKTPAMAAGLSDHVWELSELLELTNSN